MSSLNIKIRISGQVDNTRHHVVSGHVRFNFLVRFSGVCMFLSEPAGESVGGEGEVGAGFFVGRLG